MDQSSHPQISFGDVVVLTDGSRAVVSSPDWGCGQMTCFELDDAGDLAVRGDAPEILIAGRDAIHSIVGCHRDLPDRLRRVLETLRTSL